MTMLIAIEVEKIVRRRLNQIVLAVSLALLVIVYVLLWMATDVVSELGADPADVAQVRSSLFLEETVPFAMLILYFLGFVGGVVVVGSNVGSEYGWNTIRTLASVEPRRWRLLLAKLVALWGSLVVALGLGLAVALATSASISIADGAFDLSFVDAEYLRDSLYSFLRVLVATAPYFGLAVLLGTIGRSATAGIALAIGVAFLEGIVGGLMTLSEGWLEEIPRYMLDQNADALMVGTGGPFDAVVGEGTPLGQAFERPSAWHATRVLLAWAGLFLLGAFWTIRRQDLEYQG